MNQNKNQHLKIFELFGARRDNCQEEVKLQYSQYKCLIKKLQNSSYYYSKISKSYADISSHINSLNTDLCQQDCPQISKKSAITITEIINSLNSKISENLGEYSHRINSFINMYSSVMKKKYEKFMESLDNVEHYREKMKSLTKSNKDGSRYERNKSKWDSAEDQFKQISHALFKSLQNIGSEGAKILSQSYQNALITISHNYQNLEQKVNHNISTHQQSGKLKNFASFLGHQDIDNINEKLSFSEKTTRFLNKNYANDHRMIKIRLESYFSNIGNHHHLAESGDLFSKKNRTVTSPNVYKSCNQETPKSGQKQKYQSKGNGIKSDKKCKKSINSEAFNNFNNILSKQKKQHCSPTIRLKKSEFYEGSERQAPKENRSTGNSNLVSFTNSSSVKTDVNLLDL